MRLLFGFRSGRFSPNDFSFLLFGFGGTTYLELPYAETIPASLFPHPALDPGWWPWRPVLMHHLGITACIEQKGFSNEGRFANGIGVHEEKRPKK